VRGFAKTVSKKDLMLALGGNSQAVQLLYSELQQELKREAEVENLLR